MFAVIELAGKQHKVLKDETIMVEKLEHEVGTKLVLDQVLLVGTKDYTSVGRPFVESAKVYVSIEEQNRASKVNIFKKKRRKGYQKNMGHRQPYTTIRIEDIVHELNKDVVKDHKEVII